MYKVPRSFRGLDPTWTEFRAVIRAAAAALCARSVARIASDVIRI
jgi:hypothetical protein